MGCAGMEAKHGHTDMHTDGHGPRLGWRAPSKEGVDSVMVDASVGV